MTVNTQYDGSIPQPLDELSDSQEDFLSNFTKIFEIFSVNHIDFATPLVASPDEGKHTIVEMIRLATTPQTILDEVAVYDKEVTGQKDQLYIRPQQGATEIQWTNWQIYPQGDNRFFTFLPGGFILYFGRVTYNNTPTQIFFEPKPTKIVSAFFQGINTSPPDRVVNNAFIQVVGTQGESPKEDQILLYRRVRNELPRINATDYFYIVVGNI